METSKSTFMSLYVGGQFKIPGESFGTLRAVKPARIRGNISGGPSKMALQMTCQ